MRTDVVGSYLSISHKLSLRALREVLGKRYDKTIPREELLSLSLKTISSNLVIKKHNKSPELQLGLNFPTIHVDFYERS